MISMISMMLNNGDMISMISMMLNNGDMISMDFYDFYDVKQW